MIKFFFLIGVATLLSACNSSTSVEIKDNPAPNVAVRNMKGLKIAYYYSDTVKMQFDYFKKEEAIVTGKQEKFRKEVERRTKEYQTFIVRNNEKLQSGLLSENESRQIQQRAQQMEAELMNYQQNEGARLESETLKKLETISKKIEVFGKQFSEENGIDILLIHGSGGQINYINASMDVTSAFIAFLNKHQKDIEQDTK
jgi:Skp family chaperone for outer membrane proteins